MDTVTSSGTGRVEYEANVFNQYETLTCPAPSPPVAPAYNVDGDMTDDGAYEYTYDGAVGWLGSRPKLRQRRVTLGLNTSTII